MTFGTPLEAQLSLGLALLIGLAIGWVARGWGERYERQREDREIEKAGVWRCEDRGQRRGTTANGSRAPVTSEHGQFARKASTAKRLKSS
jgi:hypothetical protein